MITWKTQHFEQKTQQWILKVNFSCQIFFLKKYFYGITLKYLIKGGVWKKMKLVPYSLNEKRRFTVRRGEDRRSSNLSALERLEFTENGDLFIFITHIFQNCTSQIFIIKMFVSLTIKNNFFILSIEDLTPTQSEKKHGVFFCLG